jgi:hypothetical protein
VTGPDDGPHRGDPLDPVAGAVGDDAGRYVLDEGTRVVGPWSQTSRVARETGSGNLGRTPKVPTRHGGDVAPTEQRSVRCPVMAGAADGFTVRPTHREEAT